MTARFSLTPNTSGQKILGLTLGLSLLASIVTVGITDFSADAATRRPAAKKAPAKAAKPAAAKPASTEVTGDFAPVSPNDLLKDPAQYLNKKVMFEGSFNRFSDTGLDYKKAFRDSRDYVSLFIYRPDVTGHKIPMSELKLFFPRKKSDDVQTLDSGDVIRIKGQVFNTALNEPWVDILELKIIEKNKEKTKKAPEECC